MTFQAPGFYTKLGYKVFGELTNAPRGYSRLWFCKRLADPPTPGLSTGESTT
jgi:hypothetical protein